MKQHQHAMRKSTLHGFTLIELMTVIAIIGVLAMIATPSFVEIKRNSELTTATNSLMAAINTARTEAMKTGRNAVVAPTVAGDWNKGVTVFVDNNLDGALDAGETIVTKTEILPSYFVVTHAPVDSSKDYAAFNASGYARTMGGAFFNSTFQIARNDLTGASLLEQTRRIKIATTGRVRNCKPKSSSDATCTPTVSE